MPLLPLPTCEIEWHSREHCRIVGNIAVKEFVQLNGGCIKEAHNEPSDMK